MNKIQVAVLHESDGNPAGMTMFLAKLTQRGHGIKNMEYLITLYNKSKGIVQYRDIKELMKMPHGTIKRFSPITIALVGTSRRFLAQARTHQVGITYVSASLQYSDWSGAADFVVPYEVINRGGIEVESYLTKCQDDLACYENMIKNGYTNDTAGYVMNQAMRNILIIQGNQQSWEYFIRMRACNRNTVETQYTTMLIWKALLDSIQGEDIFAWTGPDCLWGTCREGKMSCGKPIKFSPWENKLTSGNIQNFIDSKWPLLRKG